MGLPVSFGVDPQLPAPRRWCQGRGFIDPAALMIAINARRREIPGPIQTWCQRRNLIAVHVEHRIPLRSRSCRDEEMRGCLKGLLQVSARPYHGMNAFALQHLCFVV